MTSRRRGMSANHIQEQLSLAYVSSVIFDAGFNMSNLAVDDLGIDGTIHSYAPGKKRVDFQLKSTTQYAIRNDHIVYDLRAENYNQLIEVTDTPQILILYLMPADRGSWISHTQAEMCLRICAYWVSLRGNPPSGNSSSVRVELSTANIFDHHGLTDLFSRLPN